MAKSKFRHSLRIVHCAFCVALAAALPASGADTSDLILEGDPVAAAVAAGSHNRASAATSLESRFKTWLAAIGALSSRKAKMFIIFLR